MYFNQTLHGYVDGHTLIASSLEIPTSVKRLMLLLSDMSGSRMEIGFEEYLTGYAIKELNMYAVAKTWYAPEMRRPGCVWTHTILIDFSDVPKVANTEMLLSFFRRPEISEVYKEFYINSIEVESDISIFNNVSKNNVSLFQDQIRGLVKLLYEDGDKSLFVRSANSKKFEQLFLMIWRQQWPRLKRNFSFCTGSISPRILKGALLDLQVIPLGFDKFIAVAENVALFDTNNKSVTVSEPWAEFIANDLYEPSIIAHNFFNYFGSDLSFNRAAFKSLVESYIFFNREKPNLEQCIEFLALEYPTLNEASNLKGAVLTGIKTPFGNILPKYSESALLFQLSITQYFSSIDYEKLNFSNRFIEFFRTLNDENVKLLKNIIKEGPNAKGEEIVTELAELLSEDNYLSSIWSDKQLLSVFIGLNPKLTFSKSFWMANINNQVEIINQLKRANVGKTGWQKILNILLEINSVIDPQIFEVQVESVDSIILDFQNKRKSIDLSKNWINYLKSHPSEVLDWFDNNRNTRPEVVELIVSILNPNSPSVVKHGLDSWIQFFDKFESNKKHLIKIDIHAFCLALAFNVNERQSQEIFQTSFEIIYFALAAESLDYNLWRYLESHTKPLSFWKDWDKCKKLVNTVVDFYVDNRWSIREFASTIHSLELQDRILHQFKKRK